METAIEDLFDNTRLPTGWLLIPMLLYLPFGLFLVLFRFFIGAHTFLMACLLPKTIAMRSFLLRAMCFVLGIVVNQVDVDYRSSTAKIIVTNHVTVLDHLAVDLVFPCTMPSVWNLPKVLTWCLGYKDLGVKRGCELFIENVRKHCKESDLPILAHPEGATTNGRVGLLKFGVWPFCVGEAVLPVVIEVRRFYLLNIGLSLIGSRWWSDLFWFLFSPCTMFTIRYLPLMMRREGTSEEEFANEVRKAMASALGLRASNFTCADKVEYLKRLLFQPSAQRSPVQRRSPSGTLVTGGPGSSVPVHLAVMAQQVKDVLPYVPIDVIKRDLVRSNCVSLTISNILEGTVSYVPEKPVDVPSSSESKSASASSPSTSSSSSSPDSLRVSSESSFNGGASSFGKTANERMLSFQERKQRLIETARRKYMEKHGLS